MKIKELKEKTDKELHEFLMENRQKLGQLKFDLSFKKLKNVKQIGELRKNIARVLTILKGKENGTNK